MKLFGIGVLAAGAFLIAAESAHAAGDDSIAPEFSRFRADPEHQAAVIAAARLQADQIPGLCKAPTFAMTEQLYVYQPVQFASDGRPMAGAWKEPLTATGCGAVKQFNVLTYVPPNSPPKSVALFPGTSRTDPLLARDTARSVFTAVAAKAPDCTQPPVVTNAKFGKVDGPVAANAPSPGKPAAVARPWSESWTVSLCGKTYDVPIRFTPDTAGSAAVAVDDAGIKQRGAQTAAAPSEPKPKKAKKKDAEKK